MHRDLLLEIGTEEMPASFLEPALNQMKNITINFLSSNLLDYKDVKVWATPRRLVIYIEDLFETQESQEEEIRGPAAHVGYKDGSWTEPAKKFAEQYKVSLSDLYIGETLKGKYIFLKKRIEGKNTSQIIPNFVVDLLQNLRFPKMMQWGNIKFTFGRPIRWLIVLFGDELIPVEVAGVKSSKFSRSPRFLSDKNIEIKDAKSYLTTMRENFVIVDHEERKKEILKQIDEIAQENMCNLVYDSGLLDEVNFLVEYPTALLGRFDKKYLELPEIVLEVTLEKKQRYFPLREKDNKFSNKFIVIRNGTDKYSEIVIQGNEKVVKARLEDAEYYFNEDKKIPLEEYNEKLEGIIFQESLGSIKDKVERVRKIIEELVQKLSLSEEERNILLRAVDLYKADLGTLMVSEYPELHGIMGGIYAKISGEKKPVPEVIGEYIYPRTADDKLPSLILSAFLGIADRIDSLTGYFALDLFPTGSEDPIGLRRLIVGLLKIFWEMEIPLNLRDLFEYSWMVYNFPEDKKDRLEKGYSFIQQRLRNMLLDRKYPQDVIDSVLSIGYDPVWKTKNRFNFILELKNHPSFDAINTAFNRLYRILPKDYESNSIEIDSFSLPYERELYKAFVELKKDLEEDIWNGNYKILISNEKFFKMPELIEEFFDNVLVMSPVEKEKENRLSLLFDIKNFLWEICDWSKLSK
ncbi:MAG TPA: glycine--tRNA ligase subunit beta [Dictyoglomaceae bacterium]|nr:glycine--tRNA ligase subunit beta [Dictyoglomaceae bacterium]HPU43383.1 glycine--tRNA ligase subunit beta [Dictyoglomaceae bacterium]